MVKRKKAELSSEDSPSEHEQVKQEKQRRKRPKKEYTKEIILRWSPLQATGLDKEFVVNHPEKVFGDYAENFNFLLRDVYIKKTKEEEDEHKRLYRREYQKRDYVAEKTRKRLEDPEVKAKRKMYSDKPEVKERKKKLAKVSRLMKSKLKSKDPSLYVDLRGEAASLVGVDL